MFETGFKRKTVRAIFMDFVTFLKLINAGESRTSVYIYAYTNARNREITRKKLAIKVKLFNLS